MINIIKTRKIWLSISGLLVATSAVMLIMWGLKFGIDFTGGSLLEVEFSANRPTVNEVQSSVSDLNLGSLVVQPIGEKGMIIRFQDVTEEKHQEVMVKLNKMAGGEATVDKKEASKKSEEIKTDNKNIVIETTSNEAEAGKAQVSEIRFESVGPTIGNELKAKSFNAGIIVLLAIAIFMAVAFNKVSKPVASWKYGVASIVALFHDVFITLGVFAFLGHFYGVEIGTPFVAAILTVLGYSVNDTIVVFDRIRENLPKSSLDFEGTVNMSVVQTLSRSINTSLIVMLALTAIILFGGETIRSFVSALAIGVFVGTYSSIFIASPILVIWEKVGKR
ncbi:protein translocase subunit SecF [Candidatus Parcubacteria bacterium]|nr:protein translocase subunit SecF [Patescibacteria group bacterium]MBU4309274.1 protein translocase subunit SecF [Patescibacteria group bacterium]MBU4432503.1 protein translocase subunit SecF [Patescibacteria group bacterium]MBU4577635.1 protein translocase subunit SecF [Patescibacteria group bacterium]MCG2697321.1 protein translocase subunit SecF [Candidatus Parcubacteria bacterium]